MPGISNSTVTTPSIGGLNLDSLKSTKLLLGGQGGRILSDSTTHQVLDTVTQQTNVRYGRDGAARTKQGQLFGHDATKAVDKANTLSSDSRNNNLMLGRDNRSMQNLTRLLNLHVKLIVSDNSPNIDSASINNSTTVNSTNLVNSSTSNSTQNNVAETNAQELNSLREAITDYFNGKDASRTIRDQQNVIQKNKNWLSKHWFQALFAGGDKRLAIRNAQTEIDQIRIDIEYVGNDALNRLHNLAKTLGAHGALTEQHRDQINEARKQVLRNIIEARFPGITNQADDFIDEFSQLEAEFGNSAEYRQLCGALLNQLSSWGHTRDWVEGTITQKQQAVESLKALTQCLRDSDTVDGVLGSDPRFDTLALELKLKAEERRDGNELQPLHHRQDLIKAQHDLSRTQRKLAAQLRLNVKTDKERTQLQKLFAGASMGDVRMDAQFFKAIRNTQGGQAQSREVNLLMAEVRRLQNQVDSLKKEIAGNAPLTQAEAKLIQWMISQINTINTELTASQNRVQNLTQSLNDPGTNQQDFDPPLQIQINTQLQKQEALTQEKTFLAHRLTLSDLGVPESHGTDELAGFDSQVWAERQRNKDAENALGRFADYGIDKQTADQVLNKQGGLVTQDTAPSDLKSTRTSLRDEAANQPLSRQGVEQKQLVEKSLEALAKTGMSSTDDALKVSKSIDQVAESIFNEKSDLMARGMEFMGDFSPEIQTNEYSRAVMQSLAQSTSVGLNRDSDPLVTKVGQHTQFLRDDKVAYDQGLQTLQTDKRNLVDRKQTTLNDIEKLAGQVASIQQGLMDDPAVSNGTTTASLLKTKQQERANLDDQIKDKEAQIQRYQHGHNATHSDNLYALTQAANQSMARKVAVLNGPRQERRQNITQINGQLDQIMARRKELINQQAAQNPEQAMSHDQLMAMIRAVVLSVRPKGTQIKEYNPVDHLNQIENTLTNWGVDPEIVRPELNDVMTSQLDRAEIERWSKEFKPHDQSLGKGSSPLSDFGSTLMQGMVRADTPLAQKEQRIDQQIRHLLAATDELTPGSKLRLDFSEGKAHELSAKMDIKKIEVEADVDIEHSKNAEIEIRCNKNKYELQIKPGSAFSVDVSAQTKLFKLLSIQLGTSISGMTFDGIVLEFRRGKDNSENGLRQMQTVLGRMAEGKAVSINEWNALADNVMMIFEAEKQGDVTSKAQVGINEKMSVAGKKDALELKAALGAQGTISGETETQLIVNSDTTILRTEKQYQWTGSLSADAAARFSLGKTFGTVAEHATTEIGPMEAGLESGLGGGAGFSTTWERRAYAKSEIQADNTSTGLINKAELSFEATLNGHLDDDVATRQKAGYELLKGLAEWSGHRDDFLATWANDTDAKTRLDELLRQTSGSDYLAIKLELNQAKMDEANEFLAQANTLEDPTKGGVTLENTRKAAELRKKAQQIVDDRSNYVPKKVTLVPTLNDKIERTRNYLPGVSNIKEKGRGGGMQTVGIAVALAEQVTGASIGIDFGMGQAGYNIKEVETTKVKQGFGNEINLDWVAAQSRMFSNTAPDPLGDYGKTVTLPL